MITSCYLQKKKYPLSGDRQMSSGLSSPLVDKTSLYPSGFSKLNNSNISEPLKPISKDLSFKGSSIKKPEIITISQAIERFTKEFGASAAEHLKNTIDKVSSSTDATGIKKVGDKLEFKPQTLAQKFKEIVVTAFVKLPVDAAIGGLELLKKVPGLKNSKKLDKMLNANIFKKRKEEIRLTSEAAAIQNLFEQANDKDFKAFNDAHSRLKPAVCNYSSIVERSLTRFVTGMIPAFFLANDAYNLSMYMRNNKTDAKEEKKRRFNQETARIIATTALTFGILSFFSKKTNASGGTTNLLMAGAAFVSEFVGRIMAGNPVLPVGENAARKYSEKRAKDKKQENKVDDKKSPSSAFKGNDGKEKVYHTPPTEGVLTFANVIKVVGGLLAFGFAAEKVKNIKSVDKQLETWKKAYDKHFKKDSMITREEYNKLTKRLRDNGFSKIADRYDEIIKDQKGDKIKIGSNTNKAKDILVNKILLFPVKFAWESILMMPYKVSKNAVGMFKNEKKIPTTPEEIAKEADKIKKENMDIVKNSIGFLKKIDKQSNEAYKESVSSSLLSGLDNVTKSNYSSADTAAMIRATMQAVTSAFLIADSYNMVMIDSHGQDKDLAEQKAKERTIQRGVRIAYGAFCLQLMNGIFKQRYDTSLVAAELINTGNTFVTESLERTSVGLPLTESTRGEIIETEQANLRATGAKGVYFRTMAKLTGKKPLSERAAKVEEKKA